MRISLMIGTGGGDGGSPVDRYVDEPPCQVTTGSGRVWSSQLQVRESFSLITRAAAPCLGSRAGPWHAVACCGGRRAGARLVTACAWPIPYGVSSPRHRDPTRSI